MSIPPPFWEPLRHADRRARLLARSRFAASVRGWFGMEDFVEVEPAALQVSPGNETHLHGFSTELVTGAGERFRAFLHTSPEFAMKKLLAAGETRIFALTRVFRNRERTALHTPEFTMLEWYRVGQGQEALMRDCVNVLRIAAKTAGTETLRFRGREADAFAEPERISVREAFWKYAGVDIFTGSPPIVETAPAPAPEPPAKGKRKRGAAPVVPAKAETPRVVASQELAGPEDAAIPPGPRVRGDDEGMCSAEALAQACARHGMRVAADDTWSDLFSRLLSEKVEPNLGLGRPTFLTDYPASEAALARLNPADSRLAERFELYACGVELANAFGELTDPEEQRRRFEEDMALKQKLYGESYPLDEDFLACLPYIKETSGAALGFDRVAMLASGADTIEDVQWTPVFRP